ncbi:MAGE-domain-containing protein [Pluteus cervinus]|uniref:MAGE-domain-containing protein n=1 Tax=Pluteus cervinus TaxID=181527 RepID=A0ACD3ADE9_9AGAR|nr:MAGE-domain-containing protein [Pluteus cervinus]
MSRSTGRSQRTYRATQAQPGPSQTQRARRNRQEDDSDGERPPTDNDGEDEEGGDNMEVDGDATDLDLARKANHLVRLALFTEQKRIPLKREEVSKKVLGSSTRLFNRVFERAQHILQHTFGMELVEIQTRAGLDQEMNGVNDELDETRKATGVKRRAAATGSKTYILRSALDSDLIAIAAETDEKILDQELKELPEDLDHDDETAIRTYGSILSWSTSDQLGGLGVLYVVLALILVNGRVISDMDLRSYLKRLRLSSTSLIPLTSQSTHQSLNLDQYLTNLSRQNYLDCQQMGEGKRGKGKGSGVKRGRATQGGGDDEGATYEWRWGSRAFSEVGEMGIAKFVAEFMVGYEDDSSDDEEGNSRARVREKRAAAEAKMGRMMQGLERVAGGQLTDVK